MTVVRKPRRLLTKLAVGCAVALAAVGGLAAASQAGRSPQAAKAKQVRIAFMPLVQANPYIQATLAGIRKEAATQGATVQVFDANFDAQKQYSQCQDATASKRFEAFIVVPVNGGIASCLKNAIKQGIAVVNTDFPIGPDATSGKPQIPGQTATVIDPAAVRGKWILDLIIGACGKANPCKVAILTGVLADPYGSAVIDTVKKGAKANHIQIVAVREALYLPDPAFKATQDILQATPDLNVLATNSDPMTVGAEKAVKQAGLTGKVKLTGGGLDKDGFKAISEGRWYGSFLSLPFDEGKLGARFAIRAAHGEKVNVGISAAQLSGLPTVVTRKNIGALRKAGFKAQW